MLALLISALLAAPPIRGVSVAPHYEGVRTDRQLEALVDSAQATGANWVQYIVQWGQLHQDSTEISPYRWGTVDAEIKRLCAYAHQRGLKVFILPIDRVKEQAPGIWRGTIRPADRAAWWRAYRRFILHYARLSEQAGVELLAVGSELGSMEKDEAQWRALIADVRRTYSGKLTYSANWDRYDKVPFWDALDLVGMNAYHPVTLADEAPEAELLAGWLRVRNALLSWLGERPFIFTEVGYPSVDGGARRPYHYAGESALDLEEQRRAYAAFLSAWSGEPQLKGVFIWRWTTQGGGPLDKGYMPLGKPAEEPLRTFFGSVGPAAPATSRPPSVAPIK